VPIIIDVIHLLTKLSNKAVLLAKRTEQAALLFSGMDLGNTA
jgi:hypothetical protein